MKKIDIDPLFTHLPSDKPLIISGPCSAESQEQVMQTALELQKSGIHVFRAGIWKPRTKPGGFEGVGEIGLPWLQEVKKKTGMLIAVEVATKAHVEAALRHHVDLIWIGARTTANPFAVQEIADALQGIDIPVLIKNPVNPDLELWIGAIERIYNAGIKRLGVIHRGFSSYEQKIYRNTPAWHIPIELRRRIPNLPILCDPSHIGGKRELIAPLSQQAMDLGFDGLIIESHCNPCSAWSDKDQQITPESLSLILDGLVIRKTFLPTERLKLLRNEIDHIDDQLFELLAKRLKIAADIAQFKKDNDMPVLQTGRYDEILTKKISQAELLGLSPAYIMTILEAIHEESVRIQLMLINK